MADNQTIIIKKIKKGGHGHHGGAWKVAYADFVTAMMAFFLLLWLLAATPAENLKGLADYFSPTMGVKDKMGIGFRGGVAPAEQGASIDEWASRGIVFGAPPAGPTQRNPDGRPTESSGDGGDAADADEFTVVQADVEKALREIPELKEYNDFVNIEVVPEGLKIEITDLEGEPMFEPGKAVLQPKMKAVLSGIVKVVRYLPNYVAIEGHTNSLREIGLGTRAYGNWELSADRGNASRRFMIAQGMDRDQVVKVVAKADNEPRNKENPMAAENRRVSLIVLRQNILPFHKKAAPDDLTDEPNNDQLEEHLTIIPKEPEPVKTPEEQVLENKEAVKALNDLPDHVKTGVGAVNGEANVPSKVSPTSVPPGVKAEPLEVDSAPEVSEDVPLTPSGALEATVPQVKRKIKRELPQTLGQ